MNIFAVDNDPKAAAIMLCDRHIVKMVLETAQLLCTASHLSDGKDLPYKPTHIHHPCTLWAAETYDNFIWLIEHGLALSKEYTYRYGKEHKCESIVKLVLETATKPKTSGRTPFAQAMPDKYKGKDAVEAYRNYYIGEKTWAKWQKNRSAPHWWQKQ
jgi:hypothetical protein